MKGSIWMVWLALCGQLFGEIIEVERFEEIKKYTSPDALLILDIDNTLITTVQELGSDQWFRHRLDHYRKEGKNYPDALELALPEWEAVQNITDVQLVEPEIGAIVRELQDQNYRMIGLTTRGLALAMRTIQQLDSVGIDLSCTAPTKEEVPLLNPHAILFRKGVLFTAGTHKGKGLQKLLEELDLHPSKIIFINDKRGNIMQLEEGIEDEVAFIGLRYGYLDEKVQNFQDEVADLQFEHFQHILSDREASLKLQEAR